VFHAHPCLEGIRQKTWLKQARPKEHEELFVTFGSLAIFHAGRTE
jgi:hypothetical protein